MDGALRVVMEPVPPEQLAADVLAAMRAWGWEHTIVVVAALELAARLLDADAGRHGQERRRVVRDEAGALVERYETSDPHPVDGVRVRTAAAALHREKDGVGW